MNAEKSLTFRLPTMKMLTGNPGKQWRHCLNEFY